MDKLNKNLIDESTNLLIYVGNQLRSYMMEQIPR